MTNIEKLQLRLRLSAGQDEDLLAELLSSAEAAIMARRFPFGYDDDTEMPEQYSDLQLRIAMDLYNKIGAEGQLSHSENGVQRTYESSWISESLLAEVVPKVGVAK